MLSVTCVVSSAVLGSIGSAVVLLSFGPIVVTRGAVLSGPTLVDPGAVLGAFDGVVDPEDSMLALVVSTAAENSRIALKIC